MTTGNSAWQRGLVRLREQTLARPTPSKPEHLRHLVQEWAAREARVTEAETRLAAEKAALRDLVEGEIPDTLDDMDIDSFPLPDGVKLTAPVEYRPQVLVKDEGTVYGWMRSNGYAEKLKRTVTVDFGMGEDDLATRFMNFVKKHLPEKATDRTYMHSGTEKAWAREVTEKGVALPPELSIFPHRKAKLTYPRQKRGQQDGS